MAAASLRTSAFGSVLNFLLLSSAVTFWSVPALCIPAEHPNKPVIDRERVAFLITQRALFQSALKDYAADSSRVINDFTHFLAMGDGRLGNELGRIFQKHRKRIEELFMELVLGNKFSDFSITDKLTKSCQHELQIHNLNVQKVAWQAKVGSVLFFNHLEAKKAEEDIFLRDIQFEMDRHTAAIKALNRMMMEDNYSANVDRV